jgi:glycosyltransferase involved in cell wall biosynthesis
MHICFVNMPIEYYSPVSGGAISTIIMSTARELLARGHRVSVLTVVNGDPVYQVGEVIPVEARKRDDLSFLQRRVSSLRRRLGRWDWPYFEYYLRSVKKELAGLSPAPDAVVVFNDFVSSAHIRSVLPRTKMIVWLQNEWRTRFDMARTIASTDMFLTCSEYIRQWTARTHAIPLDRIVSAPSGVDGEMFTPRAGYLDAGEPLKVLFLGRIDPNKGPDIAADAVAALRAEGLAVTLTVAGGLWFYGHGNEMDDPFFRELKPKMDAAGAEYPGHVPRARVPELVRRHDVACVLSRSNEPFGLVALEAMAGGCAVIASNRGGLPEACGEAAALVDPDDLPAVIGLLRRFATDREFLRAAKQRAVRRAANASWTEAAEILEEAAFETREAALKHARPFWAKESAA